MPKYREKPIKPKEVEAIQYTGFDMLNEILEFSTLSDFEVYGRNTEFERIVLKNGLRGINLELRPGYYLVKNGENGNINMKVYKQREFEKKFEKVPETVAKKARKMAELSGILTKNGFNFTTEIKDLSAINPGPIESPEISPANSFEIEREAHKKLIKELIREVLDDEKTSKTLAKTVLREMGIEMKRAELRS